MQQFISILITLIFIIASVVGIIILVSMLLTSIFRALIHTRAKVEAKGDLISAKELIYNNDLDEYFRPQRKQPAVKGQLSCYPLYGDENDTFIFQKSTVTRLDYEKPDLVEVSLIMYSFIVLIHCVLNLARIVCWLFIFALKACTLNFRFRKIYTQTIENYKIYDVSNDIKKIWKAYKTGQSYTVTIETSIPFLKIRTLAETLQSLVFYKRKKQGNWKNKYNVIQMYDHIILNNYGIPVKPAQKVTISEEVIPLALELTKLINKKK